MKKFYLTLNIVKSNIILIELNYQPDFWISEDQPMMDILIILV
jgi:hypothetical protein